MLVGRTEAEVVGRTDVVLEDIELEDPGVPFSPNQTSASFSWIGILWSTPCALIASNLGPYVVRVHPVRGLLKTAGAPVMLYPKTLVHSLIASPNVWYERVWSLH